MAIPQYIRVWLEDGTVYVAIGRQVIELGAPSAWSSSVAKTGDMISSNDKISLFKYGRAVVTSRYVDEFADKNNNQLSPKPVVDYNLVLDYFHSIGIDQDADIGTVDQTVTDSPNAVSGSAVIDYVAQQGGGGGLSEAQVRRIALRFG